MTGKDRGPGATAGPPAAGRGRAIDRGEDARRVLAAVRALGRPAAVSEVLAALGPPYYLSRVAAALEALARSGELTAWRSHRYADASCFAGKGWRAGYWAKVYAPAAGGGGSCGT